MKDKLNISDGAEGLRLGIADRAIWFHLILEAAEKQEADIDKISEEGLITFGERAARSYGVLKKPADFAYAMGQGLGKEAFSCEIIKAEDDLAVMQLNYCPLVEAWKAYGLSKERIQRLCRLTQYGDHGRLKNSPLKLEFKSLICDGDDCCEIHITKK